jgi:hypothetical protein
LNILYNSIIISLSLSFSLILIQLRFLDKNLKEDISRLSIHLMIHWRVFSYFYILFPYSYIINIIIMRMGLGVISWDSGVISWDSFDIIYNGSIIWYLSFMISYYFKYLSLGKDSFLLLLGVILRPGNESGRLIIRLIGISLGISLYYMDWNILILDRWIIWNIEDLLSEINNIIISMGWDIEDYSDSSFLFHYPLPYLFSYLFLLISLIIFFGLFR